MYSGFFYKIMLDNELHCCKISINSEDSTNSQNFTHFTDDTILCMYINMLFNSNFIHFVHDTTVYMLYILTCYLI